ncbi:MAG: divalent-cation tolerance protein CutA, partial [Myxococcota bacterium]|nr:divalent-cation tolerance protein CutA [Myxococcota bacterium]
VTARLAACVNIVPTIRSVYRWKGAIEKDEESLLVIKTTAARLAEVIEHVVRVHPYEVPEVVALPIDDGLPAYLSWLRDQVAGDEEE